MNRVVQPELLDVLSPADPKAIHSRQDLRRINSAMGHARLLAERLKPRFETSAPLSMVELGAGDGACLLRVAQRLGRRNPTATVSATLVDLHNLLRPENEREFQKLNWRIRVAQADAFDFLKTGTDRFDVIVANLFLHHFNDSQLKELLSLVSQRTACFFALEPRRARFPLIAARLVGLIGCNSVTRHDAVISVEAGFNSNELSELWPRGRHWQLNERPVGLFSHGFTAQHRK